MYFRVWQKPSIGVALLLFLTIWQLLVIPPFKKTPCKLQGDNWVSDYKSPEGIKQRSDN
jgi:hypothetical protein